jgi:hypothetical protein
VAKEGEELKEIMETINDCLPELIGKIKALVYSVTKESQPHESHWIVGQVRAVMQDHFNDEQRIERYLANKEVIRRYDEQAAAMGKALE